MNIENKKIVWKSIQKRGDELIHLLPEHPYHLKGRNPYAHICSLIKKKFGHSYKDLKDEKFLELINFIERISK